MKRFLSYAMLYTCMIHHGQASLPMGEEQRKKPPTPTFFPFEEDEVHLPPATLNIPLDQTKPPMPKTIEGETFENFIGSFVLIPQTNRDENKPRVEPNPIGTQLQLAHKLQQTPALNTEKHARTHTGLFAMEGDESTPIHSVSASDHEEEEEIMPMPQLESKSYTNGILRPSCASPIPKNEDDEYDDASDEKNVTSRSPFENLFSMHKAGRVQSFMNIPAIKKQGSKPKSVPMTKKSSQTTHSKHVRYDPKLEDKPHSK